MRLFRIHIVILAVMIVTATASFAQNTRPSFDRDSNFDVQHYTLRVSFDHAKRTVFGDTSVFLKPIKNDLRSVELDAKDLKFEKITIGRSDLGLKYVLTKDSKVQVNLDRSYGPDETIELRFKYSAKPKKGVYFVDEKKDKDKLVNPSQIWTQGEPDEARHWFPSFDFPSDKATSEQIITVQKGQIVIGNGVLLSQKENADGTDTFHYKMDIPHPTYLISFVVGDYVKIEDKYRDIPLGYYMYRGTEYVAPRAYGKTKEIFSAFEELTKIDYPFNKYDQTIVANFAFGGMENITATTMADSEIFYANIDFLRGAVEDLVSHEIAHSWFGNNVTCKNWAELWLNEGFATFLEAAVREKMYGRSDYIRKILLDAESFLDDAAANSKPMSLYNLNAGNLATLFDRPAVTYNKGGAVVHQLREQVGNEAFWKGVNIYLTRHRFGSVETSDLIRAMEEASGQKLDWFFDQWVYASGHPKLDLKAAFDEKKHQLSITVAQTHRSDKFGRSAYRLPLEVQLTINGKTVVEKIDIDQRNSTHSLKAEVKPSAITIDPENKIPLMVTKLDYK